MKIEDLAFKLYFDDTIDYSYDVNYFHENIYTNELCFLYYEKALKLIRKEKLQKITKKMQI